MLVPNHILQIIFYLLLLPVSHLFISNHHNLPFHVLHYTTLAAAIKYSAEQNKRGTASPPAPENVGRTRAVKFRDRERATAPSHERLWLAGVLLVVTGWIIVRLVLMPFAAH